eukprot:m.1340623 g.1340623  ORF g.1340623 m.1340623 type:complete len:155 (+) comp24890_c1_seq27:324-788(+)
MSTSGSESGSSPEPRRRSSLLLDINSEDMEHVMSVDDYQAYFREFLQEREPLCYGVVKYDYIGVNADELSLRQGDSVAIYIQDEAEIGDVGWWFGKITGSGRAGVFPLNYVDVVHLPRSNSEHELLVTPPVRRRYVERTFQHFLRPRCRWEAYW